MAYLASLICKGGLRKWIIFRILRVLQLSKNSLTRPMGNEFLTFNQHFVYIGDVTFRLQDPILHPLINVFLRALL